MLDFINELFSSGFMSIFSATLLAAIGIIEYLVTGKKRRAQNQEQIKVLNNKNVRELMLDEITLLKSQIKQLKFEKSLQQRIEKLENEIIRAGSITTHIPRFWKEKLEELQKIYDYIGTNSQKSVKRFKQKFMLLCLFISAVIYIYVGIKLHTFSLDFSNLAIWASIGVITTFLMSVFFYFYVILYIFILSKISFFVIYVSRSGQLSTSYGLNKLFFYGCIIVSYLFVSNVYKYVYPLAFPMLSGFVSNFIMLIIILTEIVSVLGSYLQIYEFVEKRLFKKEEKVNTSLFHETDTN